MHLPSAAVGGGGGGMMTSSASQESLAGCVLAATLPTAWLLAYAFGGPAVSMSACTYALWQPVFPVPPPFA